MTSDSRREQTAVKNMILASMILVPLLPVILILGIGYYYFSTSMYDSTNASMRRIITDHGQMIERFLDERRSDLEYVLNTHPFQELQRPERLQAVFEALQEKSPAFADVGIFDENGLHVAYKGPYPLTGKVYKDAAWFQHVTVHGTYISDIFLGYRDVPHFIIAIARAEQGRPWVIRATIDTLYFSELVEKVRIGRTGEAYILDAAGALQTNRRSGGKLMAPSPDSHLLPPMEDSVQSFIITDEHGAKYWYATLALKHGEWRLVVRRAVADALAKLRTAVFLTVLTMVMGGTAIILLAFYWTGMILRRMQSADAERQRLGEQLIRAARLAELGQMAAGVAHEINNPLQIIKSEQLLIEMNLADLKKAGHLPPSETLAEVEEGFQQIKRQIDRCAQITAAVLKFGRQATPRVQPIALHQFIPEVAALVAKKAAVHGIAFEQNIPEELAPVSADAAQLQQVLMNLFNNAMDAILERHGASGGRLVVSAAALADDRVKVSVMDNGTGISPENQEKIFAPFFTTKPVGKGTGLGLSVCYGIVQQMGGSMSFTSRLGQGTAIHIDLPAKKEPSN